MPQKILVLDFGGQTAQLIARRIRELGVYCELAPHDVSARDLAAQRELIGIVLSGGPASVYEADAPQPDPAVFDLPLPILGICYGMQAGCRILGGAVEGFSLREFGRTECRITGSDPLLAGLGATTTVWMSHGDSVARLPAGFVALGATDSTPCAIMRHATRPFWGLQFHPEVTHTEDGTKLLENFVVGICRAARDWRISDVRKNEVAKIRARVGPDERVICALSGGVDSAVTAAIAAEAIGDRLVAIFVDNGLLREGEVGEVERAFAGRLPRPLTVAHAEDQFLGALAGITEPEAKRKAIGGLFIDVFAHHAKSVKNPRFLAQGTLYPDVIESRSPRGGPSATIKTHHNVGGLPEKLGFELIEPLRDMFKDEVRRLGRELGLPESMLARHPFPGPGLAIRALGEVTRERLVRLRHADRIVREEIAKTPWQARVWQAFAVLLPVRSVGVMGDGRTYDETVAVRAVESFDGMTADWARLPHELLDTLARRIANEVKGVNRVVYDISSKPPATIEWE